MAVDGSNNVIVAGMSTGSGRVWEYATVKYSGGGLPLWTNRYGGPGIANYVSALAVDRSGDVIVTGASYDSVSLSDYATIKYSSTGVSLWTNRYDGVGDERPVAVAVDGNDDIIVTGSSGDWSSDYVTIKYSCAGVPLWTNRYDGSAHWIFLFDDQAQAVAVDGSNNVIVIGWSHGNYGNSTAYDYVTVKYSSAGIPLWTNRYNGPGNGSDYANSVAVDGKNNIIVTGDSEAGAGAYVSDYVTIKYSSGGLPLWTNRYNGPGNGDDQASAVAVDGSNNVIVTGYSSNGTNYDCATIQYSSAGLPLWTNRYNGPGNQYDIARAVVVDASNNVIVTGNSYDSGSSADYATIKYSSGGLPLWTNRYNGPANGFDWPQTRSCLAIGLDGAVVVTGASDGDFSTPDFATIKYVFPPVITDLKRVNGTFQMRVENLFSPSPAVIEASTNLVGWVPVFTNTMPTNVLFCTDPEASRYPWRFYRASEQW